jgi:hypothetical protein
MFLFRFMQKCGLSSSRAYCIFAQPANSNSFVQLPIHDFNNRTFWTFLLVDLRKIQYARDHERPYFCILPEQHSHNEVYCDFIVMLTSFQTISSINYGAGDIPLTYIFHLSRAKQKVKQLAKLSNQRKTRNQRREDCWERNHQHHQHRTTKRLDLTNHKHRLTPRGTRTNQWTQSLTMKRNSRLWRYPATDKVWK